MRLVQRLLHREPEPERTCPRCGVPAPIHADLCRACGWDIREAYHGDVGAAEPGELHTERPT